MERKASSKSLRVTVADLVDLAVPSEDGKDGDRHALRTILHLVMDRLEIDSQSTVDESTWDLENKGDVYPDMEFNVPDVLRDISKCLHNGMKEWVARNSNGSTCQELVGFLKMQGSAQIAAYIENCINDVEKPKETAVDTVALIPDVEMHTKAHDPQHRLESFSRRKRPNSWDMDRAESLDHIFSKFIKLRTRYPIILPCLVISIFILGIGTGVLIFGFSSSRTRSTTDPVNNEDRHFNQIIILTHEASTSEPTTTFNYVRPSSTKQSHCTPLETLQSANTETKHHFLVMPNWSADTLDFCGNADTMILLRTSNIEHLDRWPDIKCPENVTAIELSGSVLFPKLRDLFKTFCRVTKLIFVELEVCSYSNSDTLLIFANLEHLHFNNLNRCSSLYSDIARNMELPRLKKVSFKCVDFETRDNSALQYLIDSNANVSTVECHNENNCVNFNAKIPRRTKFKTGYVRC